VIRGTYNNFLGVRIALAAMVCKLGNCPSTTERLDIACRRESLQGHMEAFHRHAVDLWSPDSLDVSLHTPDEESPKLDSSDFEDEGEEMDDFFTSPPMEDHEAVKTQPLLVPSNLGVEVCQEPGFSTFVTQKKSLRIGQANDAL
jgi:hypothetical protein